MLEDDEVLFSPETLDECIFHHFDLCEFVVSEGRHVGSRFASDPTHRISAEPGTWLSDGYCSLTILISQFGFAW